MYYDTAIYWNKAETSGINKDSLLVMQAMTVRGRVLMAALCGKEGETEEYASGYLTKGLMEWFYDGLPQTLVKRNPMSVIKRHVERRIYKAQCRMYEYAETHGVECRETEDYGVKERGGSLKMTVSVLILWERKYMLWNFGSNKAYRFPIGSGVKYPLSGFEIGTVKSKDVFLICSDAFIRRIPENEIADILAQSKIMDISAANKIWDVSASKGIASISMPNVLSMERCRRRLKEIGKAAMRKGEHGSMSAVCVRISSRKKKNRTY
ncbi:MAG: hypothetical protein NC313_02560 [Butyrivibrio sp.]|nr:hypothetical protein [Butyrivibrio sp.]